ncbi:helix-turn-helix domain-containing protein [Pedobacter insulae]
MENNTPFEMQVLELLREILTELRRPLPIIDSPSPITPEINDEMLTRQQVIAYLRISDSTYRRKVKDGTLRPMKMPGGNRFYKSDLNSAFMESINRGRI